MLLLQKLKFKLKIESEVESHFQDVIFNNDNHSYNHNAITTSFEVLIYV